MSFLAPLFLAGAFVIGLPILFHLIRRSTRERTVFSSLMFLQPSPPRLSRRSRLEHLLLLVLRCAAVMLLAAGFARPFLKHVFPELGSSAPATRTLVLLDTSASMRRQNLWAAARDKAEAIARQAAAADQVALASFDRQVKSLVSFAEWEATPAGDRLSLVRNRLADIQPGWGNTHLDTAVIRAAETLAEDDGQNSAAPRRVVVVTDLQEGSEVRALQGHEWPKGVEVSVERVGPRPTSNAGLQLVADSVEGGLTAESSVRVRVSNAADSKHEQLHVGWASPDGSLVGKPVDVYVPPGQSRVISLVAPGTNAPADRIVLKGDEEPFDNMVYVVPPERLLLKVLYFGSDSADEKGAPLFFLKHALQETGRQQVQAVLPRRATRFSPEELEAAILLVVTGALEREQADLLRGAVVRGKTLLFAPTTAAAASTLGAVVGTEDLTMEERQLANYAMLGQIEFRHPLFAPFADARFSDFTKIHFWKYRAVDMTKMPNARVLAQFDTGDPALVEIAVGEGRVLLLTAGWHPADSQLALSSKFVPLLYSLLEYSGAAAPAPQQHYVGAAVVLPLELTKAAAGVGVRLPDGSRAELKAGETNFSATLIPGIYSVGGGATLQRFAVNLEPAESRTAPLPADELERLGVPAGHSVPVAAREMDRKVRLQNAELEAQQKLWCWLLLAALVVLGVETWLAGRTARRGAVVEEKA